MSFVAHFDRIGRTHDVPPLALPADSDDWCAALLAHARRYLRSRDIAVGWGINGTNRGRFYAGVRNAGEFRIEPAPPTTQEPTPKDGTP